MYRSHASLKKTILYHEETKVINVIDITWESDYLGEKSLSNFVLQNLSNEDLCKINIDYEIFDTTNNAIDSKDIILADITIMDNQ